MDEKKETVSQQTEYERDRRKGGLGDWKAIIIALIAGITAIIQPGGSIRDEESIKAANEAGIAMLFTGMRHFKH